MTANQKLVAAHETRMWITTIIVPVITISIMIASNPTVQKWIAKKRAERRQKKLNKVKSAN